MFRFFRILRRKFIEEDSFRKYLLYAFGEILLVVFGILIALQVNTWKEEANNRDKEMLYLHSFEQDLDANIRELSRNIGTLNRVISRADILLDLHMNNRTEHIPTDSLFTLIYGMGDYSIFQSREGTVKDIMGSGELELIRNAEIRSAIATWESDLGMIRGWEVHGSQTQKEYVGLYREFFPIYKMAGGDFSVPYSRIETFMSEEYNLNMIWDRRFTSNNLLYFYESRQTEIIKLREDVLEELSSRNS